MTPIPGISIQTLMQRSLFGVRAQDPVVPERRRRRVPKPEPAPVGAHDAVDAPLRIGRYDDGLATSPDARSRRRVGTFADGMTRFRGSLELAPPVEPRRTATVHAADNRRAA
jgi:hypothetical protein